jgi:hypothetical protein
MFTILLIIALFFAGCGRDSFEPNNSLKNAKWVSPGTPFYITIYPKNDIDFFKVEIPGPGYAEFTAGIEKPADMKLEVRTYDENGNIIQSGSGLPLKFPVKKGNLLFSINAEGNNKASRTSFPVKLEFQEVKLDAYEDNNEPPAAKPIELNHPVSVNIFPPGDRDFFKVSVPKAGNLIVEYDINKPVNLKLLANIYDENGSIIISDRELPLKVALRMGIYAIGIRNVNDRDAAENFFNLNFNFTAVKPDSSEPNDSPETAKKIGLNSSILINIFPLGDEDYFKITVPSSGILRIETDKNIPAQLNPTAKILDSKEEVLLEFTELPLEYKFTTAGEYFVVIGDEYNDDADDKLFHLYFKFNRIVK